MRGVTPTLLLKKNKNKRKTAALSRGKRTLFAAITVSLPLLVLVVAELALRLFGWGGYPSFIHAAGRLATGETVCLVEPTAARPYFFANPQRPGFGKQYNFLMPKPAETVRIFLFGESAAQGYPQPRNMAMSSFLQAMLSDLWPDRHVEVLNMGTTAVASFPIVYQVREALRYDPDLLVFYAGNNEFFGAYGVASINAAGALPPWALRAMRAARGLALVQVLDKFLYAGADQSRQLMERMVGESVIPADSPLRTAAARNLRENLGSMLSPARAAGVPSIVCTTASNEADMAPIGEDQLGSLEPQSREKFNRLLRQAAATPPAQAETGIALLRAATEIAPQHARTRYFLGRALAAAGDNEGAREQFRVARELDTMPWRPTPAIEEAARKAAAENGAVLCDIAAQFREAGPLGAAGWELLDDHVHLSVAGQAAAARAMVKTIAGLDGALRVDPSLVAALPDDRAYAARLGENAYDRYGVNEILAKLFEVPFMHRSNPEVLDRLLAENKNAHSTMPAAAQAAANEWLTADPHASEMRPLTAMVGRATLAAGQPAEAARLYQIARGQVSDFTSWHIEYTYYDIFCRLRSGQPMGDSIRRQVLSAIREGDFLLANGKAEAVRGAAAPNDSVAVQAQAGVSFLNGRLHQLIGKETAAVPYLEFAYAGLNGDNRASAEQALFAAYINSGAKNQAVDLAEKSIRERSPNQPFFEAFQRSLTPPPPHPHPAPNANPRQKAPGA
jgi:lysophospholipase L1-like esterase